MKILGIDSTTKILSIAVSEQYSLKSEVIDPESKKHMANIIKNIDNALKSAQLDIREIDMFCSTLGPGDFTGTRIGLSIVKILSSISKRDSYGVNSTECYLLSTIMDQYGYIYSALKNGESITIIPMLDVRNKQIYFSLYNIYFKNEKKTIVSENEKHCFVFKDFSIGLFKKDQLIKADAIIDFLLEMMLKYREKKHQSGNLIMFCGNYFINYPSIGRDLKRRIEEHMAGFSFFTDKKNIFTKASTLNYLAYLKFQDNIPSLPLYPIYVRDFIAFNKT